MWYLFFLLLALYSSAPLETYSKSTCGPIKYSVSRLVVVFNNIEYNITFTEKQKTLNGDNSVLEDNGFIRGKFVLKTTPTSARVERNAVGGKKCFEITKREDAPPFAVQQPRKKNPVKQEARNNPDENSWSVPWEWVMKDPERKKVTKSKPNDSKKKHIDSKKENNEPKKEIISDSNLNEKKISWYRNPYLWICVAVVIFYLLVIGYFLIKKIRSK